MVKLLVAFEVLVVEELAVGRVCGGGSDRA